MKKRTTPPTKFMRCPACCAARLHTVVIVKDPATGRCVRYWECSACTLAEKQCGGICCPKCGSAALAVLYNRRSRSRPGVVGRVRSCRECGHRQRTKEVVESYSY